MKAEFRYTTRLEIRFSEIPSTHVRAHLKQRGFWWDARAQCWHLARPVHLRFVRSEPISQDGFDWALEYCQLALGLTTAEAADLRNRHETAGHEAGVRGMLAACGIE